MRVCLYIFALLLVTACYRQRDLSSETSLPEELPPVEYKGLAIGPHDETPVVKTENGYEPKPLPGGIKPNDPAPLTYTIYVGPSN